MSKASSRQTLRIFMPMAIQSGRPSTLTLYLWQWHIPVQQSRYQS